MILKLQRYLGNFVWSEPFDYELNTEELVQVNNNGTGRYHLYKRVGRAKIIHYHQHKKDWEHFGGWIWRKNQLFFTNSDEIDLLFHWARQKGIYTMEQPERKIL